MSEHEVTRLLSEWSGGDREAAERVLHLLYGELKRLAGQQLRRERRGHTLQPTALVNEAYIRLAGQRVGTWRSRSHFLAVAAQIMRRILVDHARARLAERRGAGAVVLSLDEALEVPGASPLAHGGSPDVLAVDHALCALAELDPRQARVVELRFFGGLTIEETAAVLEVAPSTVKLDWQMARAWLLRELSGA